MPTKLDLKIEAAKQKLALLQAQKRKEEARENAQKRKDDTRKKILIGGMVLARIKSGEFLQTDLIAWADKHLESEKDRSLFELASKDTKS